MNALIVAVALVTVATAVACAVPGVFLVVRHQAMLGEAMGHAILPGIALGLLVTSDMASPLLLGGVAFAGVLVLVGTQIVQDTRLLPSDSAIGVVFPALFSVGVVVMSLTQNDRAVSPRTVLTGDINLAAVTRLYVAGVDVGPVHAWIAGSVAAVCCAALAMLWNPLQAASFDPEFAHVAGARPRLMNYTLLLLVALTVTVSFVSVGSLLVVALLVVPAATARLLTTSLRTMMVLAVGLAVGLGLVGFCVAYVANVPTAPALAVVEGLTFLLVALLTRRRQPTLAQQRSQ